MHYGADTRFVQNTDKGGTTIFECVHKRDRKTGAWTRSNRQFSPGSHFPKRRNMRGRDEAPAFLANLDFTPDVYFFDSPESGFRVLAEGLRQKGTLVYFEPEGKDEASKLMDAIRKSDVIKFSDENVPDVSFTESFPDKVFIQTMGPKGVRYKYKGRPWEVVEALPIQNVVDTEGAGDCFTATIINAIAEGGLTLSSIPAAIREAMENASRSVGYFGSKGFIREGK